LSREIAEIETKYRTDRSIEAAQALTQAVRSRYEFLAPVPSVTQV
jgi:hypothetical protein